MSTPYNKTLTHSLRGTISGAPEPKFASGPLEVNVIFTGVKATAAALKSAQSIARDLGARIRLRAAIAVPFQLSLDRPPISIAFIQEGLRKLVSGLEPDIFEPAIHLYLCRNRLWALSQALRPNSVVVIAGRKRWWPTEESRMVHALEAKGHRVIFVDCNSQPVSEQPAFERTAVTR